ASELSAPDRREGTDRRHRGDRARVRASGRSRGAASERRADDGLRALRRRSGRDREADRGRLGPQGRGDADSRSGSERRQRSRGRLPARGRKRARSTRTFAPGARLIEVMKRALVLICCFALVVVGCGSKKKTATVPIGPVLPAATTSQEWADRIVNIFLRPLNKDLNVVTNFN